MPKQTWPALPVQRSLRQPFMRARLARRGEMGQGALQGRARGDGAAGEADGAMADLKSLRMIDAIREAARRRLPRGLFEFIDRGSKDYRALARDPAAYDRILPRPRLPRGVAGRSAECAIPGRATPCGAAIGGEEGAARVIDILRGELLHARAMLGCATIDEIGAYLVRGESRALSNVAGGER